MSKDHILFIQDELEWELVEGIVLGLKYSHQNSYDGIVIRIVGVVGYLFNEIE